MARNHNVSILDILKSTPEAVIWSDPYIVKIEKVTDGTLGISFNTYEILGSKVTWTAITSVKHQCKINNSSYLTVGCRIIDVEGHDITRLQSDQVLKVLKDCKGKKNVLTFTVAKPLRYHHTDILNNLSSTKEALNQPQQQRQQSKDTSKVSNNDIRSINSNKDSIKLEEFKDTDVSSSADSYCDTPLLASAPKQHNYYCTQKSNGSDLTPVEVPDTLIDLSDENTPLMADFSGAAVSTVSARRGNDTDGEVIDEVLHYPWNIRWNDTEKIILNKKTRDEKVGFYYKIKMTSGKMPDGTDNDVFYLVEEVHPGTPAHGKLRKGDWIRSVNGTPITTDKELLKKEIRSNKEVILVIQRPQKILRYPPLCRKRKNKENEVSNNRMPKSGIFNSNERSPATEQSSLFSPSINNLELDDIKIDGMSVYNMLPSTVDSISPFELDDSQISIDSSLQTFLHGTKLTSASQSVPLEKAPVSVESKRFDSQLSNSNNITSNSIKCKNVPVQPKKELKLENETLSAEENLRQCLINTIKSDLDKTPYVRINQISTCSNENYSNITEKVFSSLGIKPEMGIGSKHLFQMLRDNIEPVGIGSYNNSIEDLILAKDIAVEIRADIARGKEVDKRLSLLKAELCHSTKSLYDVPIHLIGNSLQIPQQMSYFEIEVKNFVFNDIVSLWPTVFFTSNSVFLIIFDLEMLMSNTEIEVNRILTCVNVIRSCCYKTAIYLLSQKSEGTKLPHVVPVLQQLEDTLKHSCDSLKSMCSNCTCDISKIPCDFFKQIQKNSRTGYCCFLFDKDWNEFMLSFKNQVCKSDIMDIKYPKSALLGYKLLKNGDKTSIIGKDCVKKDYFSKFCPTINDNLLDRSLIAMHHCGKILYQARVPHRTSNYHILDLFICIQPEAMQHWFELILQHSNKLLEENSSLQHITATTFRNKILSRAVVKMLIDNKHQFLVILALLELYHILEPADNKTEHNEYYFTPSFYHRPGDPYLYEGQQKGEMFRNSHRKLYVDFHGFLPVNMCVSILSKLENCVQDHVEITDIFTGFYIHERTEFLLKLMPLKGFAEITVKLEPNKNGENFYTFIKSSFSKAITTNLLTYHIGPAGKDHFLHTPVLTTRSDGSFQVTSGSLHVSTVHVLDIEKDRSLTHSPEEDLNFWKISKLQNGGIFGTVGPNTQIHSVPHELLDIIHKGLNIPDTTRHGRNWKHLAELLKYGDSRTLQRLSMERNPCKSLLDEYLKNHSCTLQYLFDMVCLGPSGLQRKDIYKDITDWMSKNCIQNWMQNGGMKN